MTPAPPQVFTSSRPNGTEDSGRWLATNIYRLKGHGTCGPSAVRVTFDIRDQTPPTHDRASFELVLSGYADWRAVITCDECGRAFRKEGTRLRGRLRPGRSCSSRCLNARTGDCECECGGERHGLNHA